MEHSKTLAKYLSMVWCAVVEQETWETLKLLGLHVSKQLLSWRRVHVFMPLLCSMCYGDRQMSEFELKNSSMKGVANFFDSISFVYFLMKAFLKVK